MTETPTDDQQRPEDQQQPIIPQELADQLNDGMSIQQAAREGIDYVGQNPNYAEQQKQAAATNLLSELELDLASRAGLTPADYMRHKNLAGKPIDVR